MVTDRVVSCKIKILSNQKGVNSDEPIPSTKSKIQSKTKNNYKS